MISALENSTLKLIYMLNHGSKLLRSIQRGVSRAHSRKAVLAGGEVV